MTPWFFIFLLHVPNSCVDRKSSDLGLGGMRRDYLQTDCAINEVNDVVISLPLFDF